jgi:hypothetical protein
MYGSARGALGNRRLYRNPLCPIVLFPQTLIYTPGTRPRWSGYQLVYTSGMADLSAHTPRVPNHPRAGGPGPGGLSLLPSSVLPTAPSQAL